MESFEKKGIWWIPGQETNQIGGILSFAREDGLRLELLGAFNDLISKPFESVPVLFGYADDMGMITLGHCLPAGRQMSFAGPMYEAYWPSIAFAGAHILHPLEQTFSKTRIAFSHLGEWVGKAGISLMLARQPNFATPIKAEYTHPQERTAQLSFGILGIGFAGRTSGDLVNEFTISQDVHIDIEPYSPLSIDDLLKTLISPIQGFLTFAFDRAANITSLTVFSDELLVDLGDNRTQRIAINVYKALKEAPEPSKKRLFPHDFLFTLSDIEQRFDQVIENWFRFHADIPHCANLLTGTHYSPHLYADRVFLTLAQVSEIYHRSRFKRKKLPCKEFSRRMKLVTRLKPTWLTNWIKGQLKNELWFGERLQELVREYGECVLPVCSNRKDFVSSVVNTRNYYTHYSSGLKSRAARGKDLYLLSQALSTLVRCSLLAELGIPAKERRQLFLRNQAFVSLLRESTNIEARDLFTSDQIEARNARILSAYASGRMTQKEIAALVGLSPSSVSRIVRIGKNTNV